MTFAFGRVVIRGYFLFGVMALVLSVALSGSFVQEAQALEVKRHCMAIGITSYGMPIYKIAWQGGGVPSFSTEDREAYVWMDITLDERMTITAQWRFPNGSIYLVDEKTRDEGSYYVWFSINIRDHPAAQALGNWEVEVFADGTPMFTEQFIISPAPPFPWTTALQMVGVLIAVVATPILLTFSGMKSPPTRSSFAFSLVGGLIIAISGLLFGLAAGGGPIAIAMAFFFFGVIPLLFLGIAVSIGALVHNRVVVLILSTISLLLFVYYAMMYIDTPASFAYALPFLFCLLGVIGSVCGIFGGLLRARVIRRKT